MYIEYNGTQQNVIEYIPDTLIRTDKLTIKGKDVKSFNVRGIEMNIKQEEVEQIIRGYKGKGVYNREQQEDSELIFNAYVKKGNGYEYIINLDSCIDEKQIKSLNRRASIVNYLQRQYKYILYRINVDMIADAIIEIKAIELSENKEDIKLPFYAKDNYIVCNGIISDGIRFEMIEGLKDGVYKDGVRSETTKGIREVSEMLLEIINGKFNSVEIKLNQRDRLDNYGNGYAKITRGLEEEIIDGLSTLPFRIQWVSGKITGITRYDGNIYTKIQKGKHTYYHFTGEQPGYVMVELDKEGKQLLKSMNKVNK